MDQDLNFSIKLDFNKKVDDLVQLLNEHVPEIPINWRESSFLDGNQIEIEEHRGRLYGIETPRWWSYRYELHFYAIGDTTTGKQSNLAKTIMEKLGALGIETYLIAAFPDDKT